MPYSKASMRAVNKWMKNNYDRINLTLPSGEKDHWKQEAEERGMKMNEFIKYCVEKEIGSSDQ